jgi:hypothetical protein
MELRGVDGRKMNVSMLLGFNEQRMDTRGLYLSHVRHNKAALDSGHLPPR